MRILLCLLLAAGSALAQDYTYGKPEELKNLRKIFVDAGPDMQNRERMQKTLKDSKLGLELLDSIDGAEIVLLFKGGSYNKTVGIPQPGGGTLIGQPKILTGLGMVLIPQGTAKPRLVLSIEDEQETAFQKRPAIVFANEFLKAYKKANDLR